MYNYFLYRSRCIVDQYVSKYAKDPMGAKKFLKKTLKTQSDKVKHMVLNLINKRPEVQP